MKRVFCTGLLVVSLSVGAAGNAAAGFINGSFETGDLTGWTSTLPGYNPFGTFYGAGMDGTYLHWLPASLRV